MTKAIQIGRLIPVRKRINSLSFLPSIQTARLKCQVLYRRSTTLPQRKVIRSPKPNELLSYLNPIAPCRWTEICYSQRPRASQDVIVNWQMRSCYRGKLRLYTKNKTKQKNSAFGARPGILAVLLRSNVWECHQVPINFMPCQSAWGLHCKRNIFLNDYRTYMLVQEISWCRTIRVLLIL